MQNIIFLLSLALLSFSLLTIFYRYFGLLGIYIFSALSIICANIQVNKLVHYINIGDWQIDATLGNVAFGTIFLATDFISERYGKKEARKVVSLSLMANLSFLLVMSIASCFTPLNIDDISASYNSAFDKLFDIDSNVAKTIIISSLVYCISQHIDVSLFHKIKKHFPSKKLLFLRNNVSTLLSQLIDSLLVTFLFGLAGIIPLEYYFNIVVGTYAVKIIVSLFDTPFLYLLDAQKKPDLQKE